MALYRGSRTPLLWSASRHATLIGRIRLAPRRMAASVSGFAEKCKVAPEIHRLSKAKDKQRHLWVYGRSRATSAAIREAFNTETVDIIVFDFAEYKDRNFDVVLHALECELASGLVRMMSFAKFPPIELFKEILVRHPRASDELLAYAEALASDGEGPDAEVASRALADFREHPHLLWERLFLHSSEENSSEAIIEARAAVRTMQRIAAHAEQRASPPGYLDRRTGVFRIPFLISGLDSVAAAACQSRPLVLTLLSAETLTRSLFVDNRGSELLTMIGEVLRASTALRTVVHTNDGLTALSVVDAASGGGVVVHEAEAVKETSDLDKVHNQAIFEWRMHEVLSHPEVLNLRDGNSDAGSSLSPASFAVHLWESVRHICKQPHIKMPADSGGQIPHPIVSAMLYADLLEPRWGPTRLVLAEDGTRRRLVEWIDAQHAKLTRLQRVQYNLQFVFKRVDIMRSIDRTAWRKG